MAELLSAIPLLFGRPGFHDMTSILPDNGKRLELIGLMGFFKAFLHWGKDLIRAG